MFPEWTWIVGLWIGAAIGSFLNVVIYRMPRGLALGQPVHSFCPACKHRLTAPDLVPLLSWLVLRGRCRHCRAPVSSRYFFVELLTGALWAAIWWRFLVQGDDWVTAIAFSLFASALVAAIFTDLAHYIIPDQINAFMLFVGLAYNGALIAQGRPEAWTGPLPSAVAGALVGVGVLWGIAFFGRLLFGKDAMGHGDIKMARGIGAVLFPALALTSFGLAVIFGVVFGLVSIVARKLKPPPPDSDEDEEEGWQPESIGSLLKSGLGYVLCIDVIGLFWTRLYESWFGENPYSVEEIEDDPVVELTMIPFGPSLAAGALGAVLFAAPLQALVSAYWRAMGVE